MADNKITELPEKTTKDDGDLIPIVDVNGSITKKITKANFIGDIETDVSNNSSSIGTNSSNISNNTSAIGINTTSITNNTSQLLINTQRIVNNDNELLRRLEIAQEGSDSFVHAERIKALGGVTEGLNKLDDFIDDNVNKKLAFAPHSYSTSALGVAVPDDGSADLTATRSSIANRVTKRGLLEEVAVNVPRINYKNGVAEYLIEPTRTNSSKYSADTSSWVYNEFGAGDLGTIATGIEDVFKDNNAVEITFPANAESASITFSSGSSSAVTGDDVNVSLYMKLNTDTDKILQFRSGTQTQLVTVLAGVGWRRYDVNLSKLNSEPFSLRIRPASGTSSGGFLLQVCYPQEEIGDYPTSVIKTNGTDVTRSLDSFNGSIDSYLLEGNSFKITAYLSSIASSGSINENTTLFFGSSDYDSGVRLGYLTGGNCYAAVRQGDSTIFEIQGAIASPNTDLNKFYIESDGSSTSLYVNDVLIGTNSSTINFTSNLTSILGFGGSGFWRYFGGIGKIIIE